MSAANPSMPPIAGAERDALCRYCFAVSQQRKAMELFHPVREAAVLAEEPCAENNVAPAGNEFPIPVAVKRD